MSLLIVPNKYVLVQFCDLIVRAYRLDCMKRFLTGTSYGVSF